MSETIATLLTGRGRGAVASIAIAGCKAEELVLRHFKSANSSLEHLQRDRIYFGTWRWKEYSEELVICRTGEQQIEIHCHGGKLAAKNILFSLSDSGARSIVANEWATLSCNNRFVFEATNLLPLARTERSVSILLDQIRGALPQLFAQIRKEMKVDPAASIEQLESVLSLASLGDTLTRPFSVALIGPPNAGKSSLVNAIVGFERAIVFDQPGTTRDVVSAETALDGWHVSLLDTAGIRESDNRIERVGIEKAKRESAVADLVLLVEDVSNEVRSSLAITIPDETKTISVGTKLDLVADNVDQTMFSHLDVLTSSTTGDGIELLCERIVRELVPLVPPAGVAVPTSPWQVEQVKRLLAMLRQQSFDDAIGFLSELLD